MAYSDYLSGAQFPPANYRSAYRRTQEISANMPRVSTSRRGYLVNDPSEKRQVMRSLAQSNMPSEHLKGLAGIHTGVEHGGVGLYEDENKIAQMGFDFKEQKRGERFHRAVAQHALLHEIGHHNTTMIQGFGGTGVTEALAENYAEHHRTSRYTAADYGHSIYDVDVKQGEYTPTFRRDYRKTRKSKELPGGHGKRF